MYLKSKNRLPFILGITAIIFSRMLFVFFNDPEGPNLLVVAVIAAGIYLPSLLVFTFKAISVTGLKRLLFAIFIQVLVASTLFICM